MKAEGRAMSELGYLEWQKPYHDALLELNPQKLVQRVNEAERAILSRLQEIRIGSGSRVEAQAIEDALSSLRVLKNETVKLKRPQDASARYNTIGAGSD
jgi:hypothetical protein